MNIFAVAMKSVKYGLVNWISSIVSFSRDNSMNAVNVVSFNVSSRKYSKNL